MATRFLVRPLRVRVPDGTWVQNRYTFTGARPETVAVYGELLTVDTMVGPDAQLLANAFHRLGRAVIAVVPWQTGTACERRAWSGDWYLSDSAEAFLSTRLQAPERWINGIPTFDTDSAGHVYSPVRSAAFRIGRAHFISASDYMRVYDAFPDWPSWRDDAPRELRRFRTWLRQQHLDRRAPMDELLQSMAEWVDWRASHPHDSI